MVRLFLSLRQILDPPLWRSAVRTEAVSMNHRDSISAWATQQLISLWRIYADRCDRASTG